MAISEQSSNFFVSTTVTVFFCAVSGHRERQVKIRGLAVSDCSIPGPVWVHFGASLFSAGRGKTEAVTRLRRQVSAAPHLPPPATPAQIVVQATCKNLTFNFQWFPPLSIKHSCQKISHRPPLRRIDRER